jgi:hypothetical protein
MVQLPLLKMARNLNGIFIFFSLAFIGIRIKNNGENLEQFVDLVRFVVNIRKIWFECKILISGTQSGKSITVKGILSLLMSVSTRFYTLEMRNHPIILKTKFQVSLAKFQLS